MFVPLSLIYAEPLIFICFACQPKNTKPAKLTLLFSVAQYINSNNNRQENQLPTVSSVSGCPMCRSVWISKYADLPTFEIWLLWIVTLLSTVIYSMSNNYFIRSRSDFCYSCPLENNFWDWWICQVWMVNTGECMSIVSAVLSLLIPRSNQECKAWFQGIEWQSNRVRK